MRSLIAGALGVVVLVAVGLTEAGAQPPQIFRTIAQGPQSGIRVAGEFVIRSSSEWQALWRRHTGGTTQAAAAHPQVEFSRDMVVAVFAGEVPMGSRFGITKITPRADRVIVVVTLRTPPGPEPVDVQAATPYHIIRLPRSPLPIVFVKARTDLD